MKMRSRWLLWALAAAAPLGVAERAAQACGCLALPSPATPVVQAGERILFAKDQDNVVAYIQVQYAGSADNFAWLVPLPSVPTVEIGTDELFQRLGSATLPRYTVTTTRQFCNGGSSSTRSSGLGCGASDFTSQNPGTSAGAPDQGFAAADAGALVERASVGPYDYAVLKADDQSEMLTWLSDNRFFVPAGTDAAMKPYIHPGAYFLALKLKAGETTGDIVPVIVKYQSDLPMIPIILTQVGAVPNMGIQVWVLGASRAIPRNYHHVVLDDLPVWLGFGATTYNDALIRAVKEAPRRHGFITEYAGSSNVMKYQLVQPGRFGSIATLSTRSDPSQFLLYLRQNNYRFDSVLLAILQRYLPMPDLLVQRGVSALSYYSNWDFYQSQLGSDMGAPPPITFDAVTCASEIDMRVVTPAKKAQALFDDHPYLTRLYSALSPEDMTDDPVFSENPELPEVSLAHEATVTIPCSGKSWIRTDGGFESQYPRTVSLPGALRIEILRDSGAPEVVTDNSKSINATLGPVDYGSMTAEQPAQPQPTTSNRGGCFGGCRVEDGTTDYASIFFLLAALAIAARPRKKTR